MGLLYLAGICRVQVSVVFHLILSKMHFSQHVKGDSVIEYPIQSWPNLKLFQYFMQKFREIMRSLFKRNANF